MSGSASSVVTFNLPDSADSSDSAPTEEDVGATSDPAVNAADSEDVDAADGEDTFYATNIRYTEHTVMHRVVEINENGNRALFTEGDGNGYRDQLPVMKSGYIGKYIFHMNYIGWPLRILTNKWVFASLGIATLILGGIDLVDRIRRARNNAS